MRAVTQSAFGDPSVLKIVEIDRPEPDYGQVLIKVGAAGVNPVDLAVRSGVYPLLGEPPFTLGWDVAGVVEAVGLGVSAFSPGDEVLGLLAYPGAGNAYADYVTASPNEIIRRPAGLTVQEAGALPLAGLTAWQALVGIARVAEGQRVLIHAAAGGVGHLAVQIAKARGAHVVVTASAAKHDFLRDLGADTLIDYTTTDFTTATEPVDVVFDLVGGEYGERSAAVLKPGGVLVGAVGGNLGITPQRAAEHGVRLAVANVRPSAADLTQLAALVESGRLRVHVDQVLPLAEVVKAHELTAARRTTGKIVLVP
ncbi:NADP-dependent oxidoreductase [Streptosporangium sp. CA-135522]|uniref:NADP-dependent oxidoreductase n=1 Tax=Streptosporangium sp. CA-135522 TaxID=3240072 RepID=UPI003D89C115